VIFKIVFGKAFLKKERKIGKYGGSHRTENDGK
jgi:hypothetical protein